MFLIGSPGQEVSILRIEAAEAPQPVMKARTLPSQETAYHLVLKCTSYSRLLMCTLSIQACRRALATAKSVAVFQNCQVASCKTNSVLG
jgi:hypothetical protein